MNFRKAIGAALGVFAVVGIFYYLSRPAYPKISPKAYEYATALYSASNQHSADRLDILNELIDDSQAKQEIAAEESRWLHAIVDQARSGQWQEAVAECRVLLDCQVDKDVGLLIAAD